ncbi:MAG: class I SAM-dependent methyltransferase [Candidatus Hodarchaeota archaeon]
MIKNARLKKDYKIIDIGGGEGYITLYCAKKKCFVYHIDYDLDLLSRAKLKANQNSVHSINYIRAIAENLEFIRDELFDIGFCGEVLEHILNDESAIKQVKRILKPSGKYIITTPNYYALPYIFLRAIPYKLRVLLFKIFNVKLHYHGKILDNKSYERDHRGHVRYGYKKKELKLKLKSNGFEIEKITGFGFLMPRKIARKIPSIVYKLLNYLGNVLSPVASKILIVARKKN